MSASWKECLGLEYEGHLRALTPAQVSELRELPCCRSLRRVRAKRASGTVLNPCPACKTSTRPSPGERVGFVEKLTTGAVGRQRRETYAGFRAVLQVHGGVIAAERGFDPSRVRGVHFDGGVAQFVGEVHGERVQRTLRGVVRERLGGGD